MIPRHVRDSVDGGGLGRTDDHGGGRCPFLAQSRRTLQAKSVTAPRTPNRLLLISTIHFFLLPIDLPPSTSSRAANPPDVADTLSGTRKSRVALATHRLVRHVVSITVSITLRRQSLRTFSVQTVSSNSTIPYSLQTLIELGLGLAWCLRLGQDS